jgi:NADH-quinone oxidoreductase subunit D
LSEPRTIEQMISSPECMTLQMGPQHPSTHGVLRVELDLEGEVVRGLRPHVGYLHSGKEKIAELKTYHQWIPYTDRMDYLSPMSNNCGYVLAVERLLDVDVTERCKYLRTMLCELARISSHLLWLGSSALELGAMTPFMYTFREREKLYDIFEAIAGHRFTVSYMRVGGMARDIPDGWLDKVIAFCDDFPQRIEDYEALLMKNEIFLQRTVGLGKIAPKDAIDLGLTGPCLRAAGVAMDLRRDAPYLVYDRLDWGVVTAQESDVYARYLVRIEEMRESAKIVRQCVAQMPGGPINIDNHKVVYPPRKRVHEGMEELIHHFLLASEGFRVPAGDAYTAIEAPKGELGFYVVSDGSSRPYRIKVRSPSFVNLQALEKMCVGNYLADVVAILATLDVVLGDVDR